MSKEYHILNLGAGVQSTALYLMAMEGHWGLHFDYAIFADTKNEPRKVYQHLKWLKSLGGPKIIVESRGSLLSNLIHGLATSSKPTNERFVSIPCFTKGPSDRNAGITRRQCTREFKTSVVELAIRRKILRLPICFRKLKQTGRLIAYTKMPDDVVFHQYFGITVDESRRASKIILRMPKWSSAHFPLLDHGWSRRGVQQWLKGRTPHPVPRSACKICPLRNDHEWAKMKRDEPKEFQEACDLDRKLREPGTVCNRGIDNPMFLHRSCIPLEMVDFDNLPPQQLDGFTLYDCSGACGN